MTDQKQQTETRQTSRNGVTALLCVGAVAGMVGLSFAAVPLYELFCQVTGYGGTTQRAESPTGEISSKTVTVLFDANQAANVVGDFRPAQRSVSTHMGATTEVAYLYTNTSDKPVMTTSTFNVTPLQAGQFFNKIECFCFTEQRVEPGETVRMPVVFFVDPDLADDPETTSINTITLSYTFFPVDDADEVASVETDEQDDAS
ncbi:cytochrome c oxidase assembly protein [Coralliovum pocilloporae]|uniref:cytochrome c oxidase assembly protein n=1 Tax=Coralliovum pocilloporae TaxID=3066369 RepID=UPI003306AAB9